MLQPKLLLKKNPTFTKIVKRYLPQFTYWAGAKIVWQQKEYFEKNTLGRMYYRCGLLSSFVV